MEIGLNHIHRVYGFSPLLCDEPRILILGTLPGGESLKQKQYYYSNSNRIWKVLCRITDEPMPIGYGQKKPFWRNTTSSSGTTMNPPSGPIAATTRTFAMAGRMTFLALSISIPPSRSSPSMVSANTMISVAESRKRWPLIRIWPMFAFSDCLKPVEATRTMAGEIWINSQPNGRKSLTEAYVRERISCCTPWN